MARRTIYVGGLEELELVESQYRGRLVPSSDYVFGRFCDATSESALLWEDFRRCARKAFLTKKQRFAYEQHMKLVPHAEIARMMGVTPATVLDHIERAAEKLDSLGFMGLGCFTVIVEQCGGWGQLHPWIEDIMSD